MCECTDKHRDNLKEYIIRFSSEEYPYYLYDKLDEEGLRPITQLENVDKFVIVCDQTIEALYSKRLIDLLGVEKCILASFPDGEQNKNLETINRMCEFILSKGITRRTAVIALGGGISGNMGGMIAAMLFRGIRLIHIPTSFMAISDSVLSLKQAINSGYGKNLIGMFYKPEMVVTFREFFDTLPKVHKIAGLCETIKNALVIVPEHKDKLLHLLNRECQYSKEEYDYFIDMSIKAKTQIMKEDSHECKEAVVLEYGHTIGHAIELLSNGKIVHGEAVGLGMICAAEISHRLGYLSKEIVDLHIEMLELAGSITKLPEFIQVNDIINFLAYDNKRGYLKSKKKWYDLVLISDLGKPIQGESGYLVSVPEQTIIDVIHEII